MCIVDSRVDFIINTHLTEQSVTVLKNLNFPHKKNINTENLTCSIFFCLYLTRVM